MLVPLHQRSKPLLWALLIAAICLPALACAQIPSNLAEGPLLARAAVDQTVEVALYGPATAGTREPALLTVMAEGDGDTSIACGIVMLAAPRDKIQFLDSPPPAGWAIPNGQWSPDGQSEWRQLLPVNPGARWALGALTMAHVYFQGTAGDIFDAVLADPDSPRPEDNVALLDRATYEQTAIAFVVDEDLRNRQDLARLEPGTAGPRGAHGVRFSFPVTIRDPRVTVHAWLLLRMADKTTTNTLTAAITQEKGLFGPAFEDDGTGPPVILQPSEEEQVGPELTVEGRIQPGLLATAWVEIYAESDPELRTVLPPSRQLSDDQGNFRVPLSLPAADKGAGTLVYEIHVRAEGPAYRSPTAIRKVQFSAEEG
ncbi:MAG: hypothetical protein HPY44_21520 [Armatimonadetes bacterium]|nr:hypothetical protein [Armatimonadota bacterium]